MPATWITDEDVLEWLGDTPATEDDLAFVATVTDAANDWAFRRRQEAGYVDEPEEAPGAAAKLGAVLYAGSLYRGRGGVDRVATYDGTVAVPVASSLGELYRLLGIPRPQVA